MTFFRSWYQSYTSGFQWPAYSHDCSWSWQDDWGDRASSAGSWCKTEWDEKDPDEKDCHEDDKDWHDKDWDKPDWDTTDWDKPSDPGHDTPDLDCTPNIAPSATADAAMGCADTPILVDFSDNYADSDSVGVAITMIDGQLIAAGGPEVTLADGTRVRLTAEDSFIFDGAEAYAALDIGESQIASYTITVADSEGATASAAIEVTYCGDANTLESWAAALPQSVTFQVRATDITRPVEDAAYDIRILQGDTDSRLDGLLLEQAYCVSRREPITGAEDIDLAPVITGELMLFNDPDVAEVFPLNGPSVFNGQSAADNLDLVNWILNQQFESSGTSGWVVQRAIWELTDDQDMGFLDAIDSGFGTDAEVQELLAMAALHEGYTPGTGELIGVLIDPDPSDPGNLQPFIAALEFESYDCLC